MAFEREGLSGLFHLTHAAQIGVELGLPAATKRAIGVDDVGSVRPWVKQRQIARLGKCVHHPADSRMLPVLYLDPVRRSACAVGPIGAL
jgi:hypothetical protein